MSAFPIPRLIQDRDGCYSLDSDGGLTKRELFAMTLLPAVLSACIEANGRCIGTDHVAYNTAAHAVRIADALIAELAKGSK